MKRKLLGLAALALLAVLARLPHPAREAAQLIPVRAVYLYMDGDALCVETDTGDRGSGESLAEAAEDLAAGASGEIFLDTAEFLILQPGVQVTAEFYELLRPGCGVVYASEPPDIPAAAEYLAAHPPELTLAQLRKERP